jgi:DNA-binding LacI/PurR family transcriptional regulator
MRTLAEKLGVTKTTISLALREHPSISRQTRAKVLRLAEEMNYRPDPAIAAIAASRWNQGCPERHRVMAFLCHRLKNPHHIYEEGYLKPAQRRANNFGYRLEPFVIDDYPTGEAVTRVLYTRGIRGIVIPQIANPHSKRVMGIDWEKFTAVCCGVGRVRPPLHTVSDNMFVNTRLLWEMAVEMGFKRIGAALHRHTPIAEDD